MNVHICNIEKRNVFIGMIEKLGLDLCVVSETWFREGSGNGLMREALEGSNLVWFGRDRSEQKTWTGDGGVVVRKGIGEVSIIKSSKKYDLLWLQIKCKNVDLFVAAVYFCPEGSRRVTDGREQFLELEADILHFREKGKVICLGDFNARIGNQVSVIWTKEDQEDKMIYQRVSQDGKIQDRGRNFVDSMNSCNLVIMNGIDSKGEYTFCSHNRGQSVVDYIVLGDEILHQNSGCSIQYVPESTKVWTDELTRLSDHRLITCQIRLERQNSHPDHRETDLKKEIKGWRRSDFGDRKYWNKLKEAGNLIMPRWLENLEHEEKEINETLMSFKEHLNEALETGVGSRSNSKKKIKKKEFIWNNEAYKSICDESESYTQWKYALDEQKAILKQEHKKAKRTRKRILRKHRRRIERKLVKKLEELKTKNPREYWRQLKNLDGRQEIDKQLPNKVLDIDGQYVVDPEKIAETWARCFEKLGKQEDHKGLFDEDFAEHVRTTVKDHASKEMKDQNVCVTLDRDLEQEEVQRAIKRLKRGKAVGIDNYMNEIFLYGGERIEEATWKLCKKVFRSEEYPREWARGVIFPIFKGGPKPHTYDPLKYRGITLLSVLGKIYVSVLTERVTSWVEANHILVEEQAGFRKDRATTDQMFVITELINNRRPKRTYSCFIDIQKAYDRIWREGLWHKLQNYGMTGKMWRVIRNIYESVESCVLVNDERSRFFEVDVGLRQGCLMSPILFAIYINGLAEEIKAARLGAQLVLRREANVGILMFADDIALLADDSIQLQQLMDLTFEYSRKWRFTFNYEKCAVVVFGNKQKLNYGTCTLTCICGCHWKLGTKLIKQVESYKYLGVELDQRLSWKELKERIAAKAKKNMTLAWGMGMVQGNLSVKAAINVYQTVVRSTLEYGAVVWEEKRWEEAEKIQREMARRILKCHSKTTNEAVLGELGLWTLKTRREFLMLKYWIKLSIIEDTRLTRQVFKLSKEEFTRRRRRNWCSKIYKLIVKYELHELWVNERLIRHPIELGVEDHTIPVLKKFWTKKLITQVQKIEERTWRNAMVGKSKLRTYRTIKTRLRLEPYLLTEKENVGSFWLTRIRSGTSTLRIETGRWKRPVEKPQERKCLQCGSGDIEDEKHFILHCQKYHDLREEMFAKVSANLKNADVETQWRTLMGEIEKPKNTEMYLKRFIRKAMERRVRD